MTQPCEGCAARGHLYIASCPQCEARQLARAPLSVAGEYIATLSPQKQAMIEHERERDALERIEA